MTSATIGTPVAYAPVIEYGLRSKFDPRGKMPEKDDAGYGATRGGPKGFGVRGGRIGPSLGRGDRISIRSLVGGTGSVRLTVANADAIQRAVVEGLAR